MNKEKNLINLWVNTEDREKLRSVCRLLDISKSQFIRGLVLREVNKILKEFSEGDNN